MQLHPLCFLELHSDSLLISIPEGWSENFHIHLTDGLPLLFYVQKLNTQSQGVGVGAGEEKEGKRG